VRASTVDMSGQRFGMALVISAAPEVSPASWLCECDCGVRFYATGSKLRGGDRRSCGCARAAQFAGIRDGTKACTVCRRVLPRSAFRGHNKKYPNKVQSKCIECANECASARHALRKIERASAAPEIPPPPPSGPRVTDYRKHDRMLPIYLRGQHAEANRIARECGVSRRATCAHYDDCLDDVGRADDARCPAECPRAENVARGIDDFAGFRSAEPVYPNTADEEG